MSKYKRIQTQFRNREVLVAALSALNISHEAAEPGETIRYIGFNNGGQADVVVRRHNLPAARFGDLAFRFTTLGEAEMIVDDMDEPHLASFLNRLRQQYAVENVRALYEPQGYIINEQFDAGGVVRLQLTKY